MTRHGMIEPSAAAIQPPAADSRASKVTIAADEVATSRVPGRQYRAEAQRSGPSASTSALPSGSRAIADIGRSSKSP